MTARNKTSRDTDWIGRSDIEQIEGALKPTAYVARAYNYAKRHNGELPAWSAKDKSGKWQFDREYIEAKARDNLLYMGASEAAKMLGATRKTVQIWVDEGLIAVAAPETRRKGDQRRILREQFMSDLPTLKGRLETPAVVARKQSSGKPVSTEALARAKEARTRQREATRQRKKEWRARKKADAVGERALDEVDRQLREARSRLQQAEREHRQTQKRFESRRNREEKARAREQRIRTQRDAELRSAREARAHAVEERRAAARAAKQSLAARNKAAADTEELATELAELVRASKVRSAAAVEERLSSARQKKQAETIAARLVDAMFDDQFNRFQAMSMYDEAVREQGIPDKVRKNVRKEFFGR